MAGLHPDLQVCFGYLGAMKKFSLISYPHNDHYTDGNVSRFIQTVLI